MGPQARQALRRLHAVPLPYTRLWRDYLERNTRQMSACQRLELQIRLGFPKGQNQPVRRICPLCSTRGNILLTRLFHLPLLNLSLEVMEETGYDISPLMTDTYFERTMREQSIRLYIIMGVPETTHFEPRTRKEISVRIRQEKGRGKAAGFDMRL